MRDLATNGHESTSCTPRGTEPSLCFPRCRQETARALTRDRRECGFRPIDCHRSAKELGPRQSCTSGSRENRLEEVHDEVILEIRLCRWRQESGCRNDRIKIGAVRPGSGPWPRLGRPVTPLPSASHVRFFLPASHFCTPLTCTLSATAIGRSENLGRCPTTPTVRDDRGRGSALAV